MADENFSLSRIGSRFSNRVSELVGADSEPNAKSFDSRETVANRPFIVESEDYDRTEGPKDEMRKYWRQYETTPMVRKPILSYASQVVEPGYFIDAPHLSEEDTRKLEQWLQTCAILEGELGKDWRNFAKKAVIQQEVRGTVLVEKVPAKEDPDRLAGFKFINPETVEIVTHPNQSILLGPDAVEQYDEVPTTDEGLAAAYLQDISETGQTRWGTPIEDLYDGESKIAFTRDEIIKFTRDADVGEVFGTARLEAVSERIDGIKQKLSDNDEAIASKAYPLWMFLFGSEENPWERDDISTFMNAHEVENFKPGMKQGVRGDVSVETISGEVADIAEYLEFDINYIISAMPMPKYALGGFAESVGQIAGVAQQQDINRQIKEARRELETQFNPAIREKAEEMGLEEPDRISIRIGNRDKPEADPDINQNVIRYIGAGNDEDEEQESSNPEESLGEYVWESSVNVAELTANDTNESMIAKAVYDTLEKARDDILEEVTKRYIDSTSEATRMYEADANTVVNNAINATSLASSCKSGMEDELSSVYEQYSELSGSKYTRSYNSTQYAKNVEMATRDVLDEMMRRIRTHIRRGMESGDGFEKVYTRAFGKFNDSNLQSRASLIAQMETHRARETTKLQEFERNEEIAGVRVVNDDASTSICSSLSDAEAYFDDGDIAEQLAENVQASYLQNGFDPLPSSPPYHFGCTTELKPIYT
jgi:hypothetical protein